MSANVTPAAPPPPATTPAAAPASSGGILSSFTNFFSKPAVPESSVPKPTCTCDKCGNVHDPTKQTGGRRSRRNRKNRKNSRKNNRKD